MTKTIDYIRNMIYGLDTLVELDDHSKVPAINLDNAATTPPFKTVLAEIQQELLRYGSIGRGKGQKSEYTTEVFVKGREIIKKFLGAGDDHVVFYTNNTTDGINKLASALIESPDDIVLTTYMEHHANDLPWRMRCKTVQVDVDHQGRLNVKEIARELKDWQGKIKYVCVTAASNVTGYVNDIHRIAKLAHRHGAKIIVDGAQIVSHRPVNLLGGAPDEMIDFFAFSAHKMYSPFGGGAVVGLKDILDMHIPKFYGGGMVKYVYDADVGFLPAPDSYEAGSPNYPSIVGMLKAIEALQAIGFGYIKRYEQYLMRKTIGGLKKLPGVILYGDSENMADRLGVIPFNLEGIPPETVADYLAGRHGIAVRHAAFCAHPYVYRLTGENPHGGRPPVGMVRASFGIYTNEAEVDTFLSAVTAMLDGDTRIIYDSGGKNGGKVGAKIEEKYINRPYDRG